jgi:hypothetical protein
MNRGRAALDEHDERHSDRPTIPASDMLLEYRSDQDVTTKTEVAGVLNGATVRARASDFRALLEAERRLADTARSGVRAIAPEIAAQKAASVAPIAVVTADEKQASAPTEPGVVATHVRGPRRFVAGLVFTVVMVAALGLLCVALSRKGILHFAQTLAHER